MRDRGYHRHDHCKSTSEFYNTTSPPVRVSVVSLRIQSPLKLLETLARTTLYMEKIYSVDASLIVLLEITCMAPDARHAPEVFAFAFLEPYDG